MSRSPIARADLEQIARKRIYFGHQSVGSNILQGVKELADAAGVRLRIVEARQATALGAHGLGHVFVAENGDPLKKIESFAAALGQGSGVDIALLKFCYVDVKADSDAKALFDRYRASVADVRVKNPRTTLVHVTLPLTTVQTGPKACVKRVLGRAPYGTIENVRREEYNALLRGSYAGREPIFDLARLESTAPDGSAIAVNWKGLIAPALFPAYTDDGGHLNAAGRRHAARELARVLATVSQPLQKFEDSATPVRISP